MRHAFRVALLVLLVVISVYCQGSKRKIVNVELQSKWKSTSLLLEASEYFASESNELFWEFIDKVLEDTPVSTNTTDEQEYNIALQAANKMNLSQDKLGLLKLALTFRQFSPKVEMYRHYLTQRGRNPLCPDSWVQIGSQQFCSINDWDSTLSQNQEILLGNNDHTYPNSGSTLPIAILYDHIGTSTFHQFHSTLIKRSNENSLIYILRHAPLPNDNPINLQGYGVELAIKSTEYKVIDDSKVEDGTVPEKVVEEEDFEVDGFIFSTLLKRKPELSAQLENFKDSLMLNTEREQFGALKSWQVKDLGLQAAQRIQSAPNPLAYLSDLSHNFPSLATSLSRLRLDESIREHVTTNQQYIHAGQTFLSLHGQVLDITTLDPFSLFEKIQQELSKSEQLRECGISSQSMTPLLSLSPSTIQPAFDIRGDFVYFFNDLELDGGMYSRWPRSLNDLFKPTYPGQLRHIAKNIITIVFVVDPESPLTQNIMEEVLGMVEQGLPARVGFLFRSHRCGENGGDKSDGGGRVGWLMNTFFYVEANYGAKTALNVVRRVNGFTKDDVAQAVVGVLGKKEAEKVKKALDNNANYDELMMDMCLFVDSKGIDVHDETPRFFINGKIVPVAQLETLGREVASNMYYGYRPVQMALMKKAIDQNTDIYAWLMSQDDVFSKYSPVIFNDQPTYIKIQKQSVLLATPHFVAPHTEGEVKGLTHALAVDFATEEGITLALTAITRLLSPQSNPSNVRVIFLNNPALVDTSTWIPLAKAVQSFTSLSPKKLTSLVELLTEAKKKVNAGKILDEAQVASLVEKTGVEKSGVKLIQKEDYGFAQQISYCKNYLNLQEGDHAVVLNGRVILLKKDEALSWSVDDFVLLERYESVVKIESVKTIIENAEFVSADPDDITSAFISDAIAVASSVVDSADGKGRADFAVLETSFIARNPNVPQGEDLLTFTAIIDPLSAGAQKLSGILLPFVNKLNISVNVILNPQTSVETLPLKSFYRFVIEEDLEFGPDGEMTQRPSATFNNLPTSQLLTLHMDTPFSWFVEPTIAAYDLDNIRLSEMGTDTVLYAKYELEHILVQGHCSDSVGLTEPRGLQLNLGTALDGHLEDTLVMSNFGYFQLKANPGVWYLQLAEGRPRDLYNILESGQVTHNKVILVNSFGGASVKLDVRRVPGRETEPLIEPDQDELNQHKSSHESDSNQKDIKADSSWSSFSWFSEKNQKEKENENEIKNEEIEKKEIVEDPTIHIFSVASGHLYERFLKIMMVSVLNHTKSPVKFWFLKNFLSPKFKEFIPYLAERYNCSVELVTYKWPVWLHQETEKQRQIWGFKILFLDVLFPLNLDKVIYVDADQVVRADMKELYNMDLHGAALAYTPFCSSRTEMDGFRFWSQGYWKNHLGDKPYHISALYVVDLRRLRRMGAADQLRGTYQALSNDENSLSNLDQDLPNFLQHQVPIFSLPQEWLWCETWCNDESKENAKTIDLCNNPLTKTPKLDNAVRIIPEWTELDGKVKQIEQEFYFGDGVESLEVEKPSSTSENVKTDVANVHLTGKSKDIIL